ncbi:NAD(P)/FAD-dependent oxidoreductase [Roseibacillus ishigakijimensis]|uniref:FAD-binding protein n=1 Tax=Roseibacillus ishigakijimensis TaxID=454146 RepID=A0A934VMK1_9BACT|nr:FAD-dependent oxidoreductase [Roseibacillus ishigakijimensis]MBK1834035.1 FAD-binding protein [Roseibacillus ishigakijimensis]
MITTVDIVVSVENRREEETWRKAAARKLKCHPKKIRGLRVLKESIDARRAPVKFQLRLQVAVDEDLPAEDEPRYQAPAVAPGARKVLIVGCGPAGMFAALRCLELGLQPIVLERGKDASTRRFDLAPILRKGTVIEDSNYCFGEGGAGTYSDGKLYTRATKRGPVKRVYETLVAHGAPPEILVDAHPHIGSNLLPKVVMAMRESIRERGGEVRFGWKVTALLRAADGSLEGVRNAEGEELRGEAVILATGHSARDVLTMLRQEKIALEAKPFAVGVRIEHPQPLIDSIQYHYPRGQERPYELPAARYALACEIEGRGVHSFCMCPGGFIVPAATENDEVVVNGMSLARRDSPFANTGMVVGVDPSDLPGDDVLRGIHFQKDLERTAKRAGNGENRLGQIAPAQRLMDFLAGQESRDLPETSYFPGLQSSRLDELMPQFITRRMQIGLKKFGRRMKGYLSEEALMIGFETRTSCPVRVPREDESLQHPDVPRLYPCGEGAGYAGGIVSAALDGMRVAEAIGAHRR